jgi:hypothetical protein
MELLNEDWQRELIAQPESGMGYQDVAIKLRNGETRYGTAFNAQFLLYSGESATLLERISEPFQRLLMLEEKQLSLGEEILAMGRGQIVEDAKTSSTSRGDDAARRSILACGVVE